MSRNLQCRAYFWIGFVAIVVLVLVALFVPIRSAHVYRSVRAESHVKHISNNGNDYLIDDGDLFLRIQTKHYATILNTYVTDHVWATADVESLRTQHPEISDYLPDPTQLDGGISWIERQ